MTFKKYLSIIKLSKNDLKNIFKVKKLQTEKIYIYEVDFDDFISPLNKEMEEHENSLEEIIIRGILD